MSYLNLGMSEAAHRNLTLHLAKQMNTRTHIWESTRKQFKCCCMTLWEYGWDFSYCYTTPTSVQCSLFGLVWNAKDQRVQKVTERNKMFRHACTWLILFTVTGIWNLLAWIGREKLNVSGPVQGRHSSLWRKLIIIMAHKQIFPIMLLLLTYMMLGREYSKLKYSGIEYNPLKYTHITYIHTYFHRLLPVSMETVCELFYFSQGSDCPTWSHYMCKHTHTCTHSLYIRGVSTTMTMRCTQLTHTYTRLCYIWIITQ